MPENKELATNLKLAKTKPMYFAFVAKGTEGILLVDKKKIPPKEAAEAKKECGGGTIYKGRCKGEEGTLVFEMAKEAPGTLAALTKKIIKRDTALTLDVEYRVAADLEDEGEESEATEGAAETSTLAPPPPPPSPPPGKAPSAPQASEGAARFAARLKALAPALEKAEAANKAVATQAKAQVGEGNKAYLAKQYDDANAALDRAETLIKQALTSVAPKGAAPPSAPPPSSDQAEKRALARLKALEPVLAKIEPLKSQEAKDAKQAIKEANGFAAKKDFDSANGTLDIAESLIKQVLSASAGGFSLVKLGKARLEWNGVRLRAVQELQRLKEILQEAYQDDPKEQAALSAAEQHLNSTIASMNEELGNALDQVLNGDSVQRPQHVTAAKSVLARFVNFVQSDELMSLIDGNEYAPDMQIAAPMRAKLQEIAASLG